MTKMKFLKDINFYLAGLFFYFTFFQIGYLSVYLLLIFLFANFDKLISYKNIFFSVTICFYILRFLFALSSTFDNLWKHMSLNNFSSYERFWDLQLNLISMKCIFSNVENYYLKFSPTSFKSCPYSAKYGPLSTKVPYFGDIWVGTIILSLVVILFLLYFYVSFYSQNSKNFFLVTFLFMSPSFNFLIERMNIDIFIFIFSILCINYYEKFPKASIVVILILSLYKIHPIGLLFGLLFCSHLKKNKYQFNYILNSIIIFFILYFLDSIFFSNNILDTEWRPAGLDITFGILSDSIIISKYINIEYYFIYPFLILVPAILALFSSKEVITFDKQLENKDIVYFFSFSFFFLINFLYANYDYRLPLFLPLIYIMSKYSKNNFTYIFIFLMPLSIPPLLGYELAILNKTLLIIGRASLYFFYYVVLTTIKNYFFSSMDYSYLNDPETK